MQQSPTPLDIVGSEPAIATNRPRSSQKTTAFWTAYKTLADEFDREFQARYGNDLDSSLIFAGLFSAVSSAFIIQYFVHLVYLPT
ncbi:hypothetical protein B0H11DRAFT_1948715 [Mycena galericulata]|nr:hypothetical protein B0H11DRAFT_1948715 [Mycena galericulata]